MKYRIILFVLMLIWGLIFWLGTRGFGGQAGAEEDIQPAIREIRVPTEHVTLSVRIAGNLSSGHVLIGINGGPGQSSGYMRSLDKLAGTGLAVVTYDQRGTGKSTAPTNGYGLTEYAADLEAVRRAVGAGNVHVFGHSWGGIVAMHYAAVHPRNVCSIILMGSGPPTRAAAQAGQAGLNKRIAGLQERGTIAESPPPGMKSMIEFILPAYFSNPEYPIPVEIKDTSFSAAAYQQTLAAVGDWDLTEDAAGLTHPVLFLWGEDDPFGLPMAETTRKALSKAALEFVVLKRCGHYWHECGREFFEHVRAFLKKPCVPSGSR